MLGLVLILIRLAVAIEPLAVAPRASFNVATLYVELSLDGAAVMAGHSVSAPIVWLVPIADACNLLAVDDASQDVLSLADPFRPVGRHGHASKNDLVRLFAHEDLSKRPNA
jgi:hypothetical protein